jgi:hypothetical protein
MPAEMNKNLSIDSDKAPLKRQGRSLRVIRMRWSMTCPESEAEQPVMVNRLLNFLSELRTQLCRPAAAVRKLPLERMPNREPQNQ